MHTRKLLWKVPAFNLVITKLEFGHLNRRGEAGVVAQQVNLLSEIPASHIKE